MAGLIVGALVVGCGSGASDRDRRSESLTSGRVRIAADPDVAALVRATAEAFTRTYPAAEVSVEERPAREAMADLFANRADLAVVGREIEPIERQAAVEARLEMEAYRWARQGVAVIAHPSNPVQQLSYDDLRAFLSEPAPTWAAVGGADRPVVPVIQDPHRGLSQYVARQLLEREHVATAAVSVADDSSAVAAVRRTADALGFVAHGALAPGVRALALSRAKGLPYVELDVETVYHRDYPLTRSFNLVTRVPGVKPGQGFITFATSEPGQRLVRDFGLVPATVPVRFVRRAPLEAAHTADPRASREQAPAEETPAR